MKKLSSLVVLGLGAILLASCGGTGEFDSSSNISLYSRDTTSGTRDGFFTTIGLEEAKADNAPLKTGLSVVNSNGDMISGLGEDIYGIGYFSLSSVNEETGIAKENANVKTIQYNGVTPTQESVLDGSYQLTRNFNYIIRSEYSNQDVKDVVDAFAKYMFTQEGMAIMVSENGILSIDPNTPTWDSIKDQYPIMNRTDLNLEIKVGGSTSVEDMSIALTDAFSGLFAEGSTVTFNHNHTGSGDAYKNTQGEGKDSANALDLAFLSRELESNENAATGTSGKMCTDAIVVGVNVANPITEITDEELVSMYSLEGTTTTWSQVL